MREPVGPPIFFRPFCLLFAALPATEPAKANHGNDHDDAVYNTNAENTPFKLWPNICARAQRPRSPRRPLRLRGGCGWVCVVAGAHHNITHRQVITDTVGAPFGTFNNQPFESPTE